MWPRNRKTTRLGARNMQTIDEVREHCRFVGKGIEKMG